MNESKNSFGKYKEIGHHVYCFNEKNNGGESLTLTTVFSESGILHQEISLQSYCNAASFTLGGGLITPGKLRELANAIEEADLKIRFNQ